MTTRTRLPIMAIYRSFSRALLRDVETSAETDAVMRRHKALMRAEKVHSRKPRVKRK